MSGHALPYTHRGGLRVHDTHDHLSLQQGVGQLGVLEQHRPSLGRVVLWSREGWCDLGFRATGYRSRGDREVERRDEVWAEAKRSEHIDTPSSVF